MKYAVWLTHLDAGQDEHSPRTARGERSRLAKEPQPRAGGAGRRVANRLRQRRLAEPGDLVVAGGGRLYGVVDVVAGITDSWFVGFLIVEPAWI